MKIIGIGFGRTGTLSLKTALEDIGAGPCLHMIDLLRDNSLIPPWYDAAIEGEVDLDAMFAGFESSVDWPGCSFWREIMEHYPDTPLLLNYRDFDGWHKSCLNTIYALRQAAEAGEMPERGDEDPPPPELWATIGKLIYEHDTQGLIEDPAGLEKVYYERIEEIKRTVPADRLILWKLEDSPGWQPITDALGIAEPDAPFPHLHDTEAFRAEFGLPPLAAA